MAVFEEMVLAGVVARARLDRQRGVLVPDEDQYALDSKKRQEHREENERGAGRTPQGRFPLRPAPVS